jgi:hypothetical protein
MCMFTWELVDVNLLASLLSMRGVAVMNVCVQRARKRENVRMSACSYLLFLQEEVKGIIIMLKK